MDTKYSDILYTWFEKCGIISNIRTHLRKNLIHALKRKDLCLKDYSNKPKAAKQYVYDFLIAEYLLNVNYAYTLSVFASEAPLLIHFDDNTTDSCIDKKQHSRQKLQRDYICHTIETLGIKPNDPEGQYIISEYIHTDAPLLLCILKCISLCSLNIKKNPTFQETISICTKQTQTDATSEESIDVQRLRAIKKKILKQKHIFDAQLKEKEMELRQRAVIIEEQLGSLNEKLEKVQNLMDIITLKEQQLNERKQKEEQYLLQKEIELSYKQNAFLLESERFQRRQDIYKNYECNLEQLQQELATANKSISSNYELRDIGMQTNSNHDSASKSKDEVSNVEKVDLSKLLHDQQLKINELTHYTIQLSNRLEEVQQLRSLLIEDPAIPIKTLNTNTIASESSSTEDILQDAKLRLKRLEEESLKADRFYYNCIAT